MGGQKEVFHCDKCGICRVGGREKSFHCDTCECCIEITKNDRHKCVKSRLKQDCPICLDDMQNSRIPATLLQCGHTIHGPCLKEYLKTSIACPLCKKSIVDMTAYESYFDQQLADMPMPEEY